MSSGATTCFARRHRGSWRETTTTTARPTKASADLETNVLQFRLIAASPYGLGAVARGPWLPLA